MAEEFLKWLESPAFNFAAYQGTRVAVVGILGKDTTGKERSIRLWTRVNDFAIFREQQMRRDQQFPAGSSVPRALGARRPTDMGSDLHIQKEHRDNCRSRLRRTFRRQTRQYSCCFMAFTTQSRRCICSVLGSTRKRFVRRTCEH